MATAEAVAALEARLAAMEARLGAQEEESADLREENARLAEKLRRLPNLVLLTNEHMAAHKQQKEALAKAEEGVREARAELEAKADADSVTELLRFRKSAEVRLNQLFTELAAARDESGARAAAVDGALEAVRGSVREARREARERHATLQHAQASLVDIVTTEPAPPVVAHPGWASRRAGSTDSHAREIISEFLKF